MFRPWPLGSDSELFPAWRWSEKTDAVEEAKLTHGLSPDLPDFYNIMLERPKEDSRGYGLLYVDVSTLKNVTGYMFCFFQPNAIHACKAILLLTSAVKYQV